MHEAETAASYRCKTTAKNDGLSREKDAKWTDSIPATRI